jgi:hypothetical protein
MQIVKIKCIKQYWTEDLPFTYAQAMDKKTVLHKKVISKWQMQNTETISKN